VLDRLIDARGGRPMEEGMIMVEGAAPGAFAKWLPALLAALAAPPDRTPIADFSDAIKRRRASSRARSPARIPGGDSARRSVWWLRTTMRRRDLLDGDRLNIRWPDVGGRRRSCAQMR
jgi:hypothetical protein